MDRESPRSDEFRCDMGGAVIVIAWLMLGVLVCLLGNAIWMAVSGRPGFIPTGSAAHRAGAGAVNLTTSAITIACGIILVLYYVRFLWFYVPFARVDAAGINVRTFWGASSTADWSRVRAIAQSPTGGRWGRYLSYGPAPIELRLTDGRIWRLHAGIADFEQLQEVVNKTGHGDVLVGDAA